MARLWTEGFELGAQAGGVGFFDTGTSIANATGATYCRSGTNAAKLTANGTATKNVTAISEFYLRSPFAFNSGTYITNYFLQFRKSTTPLVQFKMVLTGSDLTIGAYVSTTLVATGVIKIYVDTWYCLEVYCKIADSGGRISVKIDGIQDTGIDYTGDTKPGADTTIDVIAWQNFGSNTHQYLDDLAMNDTSDVVDNSWCGDGHIVCLRPNGDSGTPQWTKSGGATNAAAVDETNMNSDTDYNAAPGTAGLEDLYTLTDTALGGNPVITRVWHEMYARDAGGTAGQIKGEIQCGGTKYDESTFTLTSAYTQCKSTPRTVDPKTTNAWGTTNLDSLLAGIVVV